jgi:hypothetical protein
LVLDQAKKLLVMQFYFVQFLKFEHKFLKVTSTLARRPSP